MPSMSFDLAPPQLTPPPSRFLRTLQLLLMIASISAVGVATLRLVVPDALDHAIQSLAQ